MISGNAAAEASGSGTSGAETSSTSGTFADNLKLPVHRWFLYSVGFSAEWAEDVIRRKAQKRVLDPFCDSGTTLLAVANVGVDSVGI